MGWLRTIAFTAAVASGMTGIVHAADLITLPVSSGPATVPLAAETGFDWGGFYAGVYGVVRHGDDTGTQYGLGIDVGANLQLDVVLLGADVAIQGLGGGDVDTAYGQVTGRAGLVLTDDVVLYAVAGYGFDLGASSNDEGLLGGGVEFAVSDDVSLDAQYLHGFATDGGGDSDQFKVGARFHF